MSNLDDFKAITNEVSSNYHRDPNWDGATFEWLKKDTHSTGTSKAGTECLFQFLRNKGFTVQYAGGPKALLYVDGHSMIIRIATIGTSETFIFNQLRDDDAELVFCVGVSYEYVYMWVAANHEVQTSSPSQHAEKVKWKQFAPGRASHSVFNPNDGDIEKICDMLQKAIANI